MRAAVRYVSRGGGTKRLAEAIAAAVGAEARTADTPLEERADTVFLGASVYAGKPDAQITRFIQRNGDRIGKLVVFGSSASGKSTHPMIQAIAGDAGVPVAENYYYCPGAFLFLHRGRPNEGDCAAAAAFAREQL